MAFKYELVKVGNTPTWNKENVETFVNPVSVGDKLKPNALGSDLVKIAAIEHYPTHSVLYYV